MTQEEKQLLLQDLCARLPYGVIVNVNGNNEKVDEINPFEGIITCGFQSFDVNECKPYLRSMSSMTEEEKNEHFDRTMTINIVQTSKEVIDWLNTHHFDYRGLIPKGLAIAVTDTNNPYEREQ